MLNIGTWGDGMMDWLDLDLMDTKICHQCHHIIRGEGKDNSEPCKFCQEIAIIAYGLVTYYEEKYYPREG